MKRVKIVVIDDHALFRAGLIGLLEDMPEFQVVGEAANGEEGLSIVHSSKPDVVLLDVNMPVMNGVEAVRALRQQAQCRIIMLTVSKEDDDLFDAITAGADGYLLKNLGPDELRKSILRVIEGNSVLSPEVTRQVLKLVAGKPASGIEYGLSQRELEVLACLAQGKTTTQIAARLYISENTVKTHVRHILHKLEASNRAEAVSKAARMGLIQSP